MRPLLSLRGRTPTDDVTLTADEQAQLNNIMWGRESSFSVWPKMAGIILAPLVVYVMLVVLYDKLIAPALPDSVFANVIIPIFVFIIGGSMVVMFGMYLAARMVWEPRYRRALREIGCDLCERCEYRMDGLDAVPQCPECGTARVANNK